MAKQVKTNFDLGLPKEMEVEKAAKKLRIAFVYSRMPFPMMRGDQLTVAHLLSFFSARGHAVDFFTLNAGGHASDIQLGWLQDVCREVHIYPHSNAKKLFGILRGLLSLLPVQVGIFNSSAMKHDVKAGINQGKYDVAYVYYLRSAEMVPHPAHPVKASEKMATVLAMQLSQTLNTQRMYENETGFLKKCFYLIETILLRRYETRIWQRFTRTVLIGPRDVEAIRSECRRQKVKEIDNWIYGAHGTDVSRFFPAKPEEIIPGRIVFSGSMRYTPNIQAVLWFVEKCWAEVRSRCPNAELIVQGRDPYPEIRALHGKDGIVVTGTVPDVSQMIRSAAVCINPMLAAGGMQNKLIEYFASNKAVVATAVANEGIGATPGEHFWEANDPSEFTEAVVTLLENDAKRDELGRKSREFAQQKWTWEAHFLQLEQDILAALPENRSTAAPLNLGQPLQYAVNTGENTRK